MNSSFVGFCLALTTAISVFLYGRLVKDYGVVAIAVVKSIEVLIFIGALQFLNVRSSLGLSFLLDGRWWIYVILSGVITLLWFWMAFYRNVAIGAVWESAYVPMLVIFCLIAGTESLSLKFAIGSAFVFIGLLLIGR